MNCVRKHHVSVWKCSGLIMFFSLRFLRNGIDFFFWFNYEAIPFFYHKKYKNDRLHVSKSLFWTSTWSLGILSSCFLRGWVGGCQGVRQHFLKFFCNVTYYFETLYKLTRILLTAANKRDMGNGLWPRLIFQANTISKNFNWKPFGQKLHQDIPPIFIYLELTEITTKFSNPEYFIKLGFTSIVQIFSYRN